MRWADLPTIIIAIIWTFLLLSGVEGVLAIEARHVPGYPATGQWVLYVLVPAFFLAITALAALLSRKASWFYEFYPFSALFTAFAIVPVLLFWGGGV